jgi:phospholipase C
MPPKIEHLVVLMMENRSFDHMLGFLKSDMPLLEGLTGTENNPAADGGSLVVVTPDAHPIGDFEPGPAHEFVNVNVQLFGTEDVPSGATPTMDGFVRDYAQVSGSADRGRRIMRCFAPENVPVLATLAQQFAVCDHWFSSVPGPTSPNRAFAHAASSNGSVESDPWWHGLKTIYEVLDANSVSNRIYTHGGASLTITVDYLAKHQETFREYNEFVGDCQGSDLPAYTFIEPRYSADDDYMPNDEHPDADVRDGEDLIREVYRTIRNNLTLWNSTLLLVVYDEHGGIYDHVPPPSIPASGPPSQNPPFAFDRLGLRVPAVLISPYIEQGTIDKTQYEHSSIVATIRRLFLPTGTAPLTDRDQNANTFDRIVTRDQPRTDTFTWPAAGKKGNSAPSELALTMVRHMGQALDRHGLTTSLTASDIKTQRDATAFMREASQKILGKGQ